MIVRIENGRMKAEIQTVGAELRSLVDQTSNREYMWSGDETYWSGVSPLLFPFIGMVRGGNYRHGGKEYSVTKHGFVRREEFRIVSQERDRVVLAIEDTQAMRDMYPFSFCLEAEYILTDRGLEARWRVINKSRETMPFSIGGHPAFLCPPSVNGEVRGNRTDCFLRLTAGDGREQIFERSVIAPCGLLGHDKEVVEHKDGLVPIVTGLFERDALLFLDQIQAVSLCDSEGRDYVRVECDAPAWGIWSVNKDRAGYVCIEPWWGLCDYEDYEGELSKRPLTNFVEPGETWKGGYRIEIC